jgi:hypothetical protein
MSIAVQKEHDKKSDKGSLPCFSNYLNFPFGLNLLKSNDILIFLREEFQASFPVMLGTRYAG